MAGSGTVVDVVVVDTTVVVLVPVDAVVVAWTTAATEVGEVRDSDGPPVHAASKPAPTVRGQATRDHRCPRALPSPPALRTDADDTAAATDRLVVDHPDVGVTICAVRPLPEQDGRLLQDQSWRVRRPALLYDGLTSGALVDHGRAGPSHWPVAFVELGTIPLGDGSLVACDPYVAAANEEPFTRRLAPGDHDVVLAIATVAPDHRRNVAALLTGTLATISGWELGLHADQRLADLEGDEEFFGYPVDAGTGCFASPAAFRVTSQVLAEDAGRLEDPLSEALEDSAHDAVVGSAAPGAPAVAMFTSGWGDGAYPTWFGIDGDGKVSVVVTDFLVNSEAPPVEPPAPPALDGSPDGPGLLGRMFRRRRN